jgi:hypothetical protein
MMVGWGLIGFRLVGSVGISLGRSKPPTFGDLIEDKRQIEHGPVRARVEDRFSSSSMRGSDARGLRS